MQTFYNIMGLIIGGTVLYYIYLYIRGSRFSADDNHFKQAGVLVDFQQGTIKLGSKTFKAGQVTGISTQALNSSSRHGDSKLKSVVIDMDDFKRPQHKVTFYTRNQAQKFSQRLCIALRKAGGRDFV